MATVLQEEIERHQSEEKKLLQKRRELEDRGIKLPEVAGHQGGVHGVLAPGFNPKDTAETYVRKIMANRKRIEYTIARYEEEQKAKLAEARGEEATQNTAGSSSTDQS